jgi:hypothetical protein
MQVWKGTQLLFNWLRLILNLPGSKAGVGSLHYRRIKNLATLLNKIKECSEIRMEA